MVDSVDSIDSDEYAEFPLEGQKFPEVPEEKSFVDLRQGTLLRDSGDKLRCLAPCEVSDMLKSDVRDDDYMRWLPEVSLCVWSGRRKWER